MKPPRPGGGPVDDPDKPGKKKTVKVRRKGEEAKSYFHKTYRTFQMSDHLPMRVELKVDFSEECLDNLKAFAVKA